MRKITLPSLHNIQPIKKILVIYFFPVVIPCVLKEILENAHIQSFAKAPRACKKIDQPLFVQQVLNKHGFINKIITPCNQHFKIVNADW